jgi:DNA invertase Pin-like site-specific DNA recombinase
MLSVFSEFETNLRHERQMEGVAKAKAEGRYTGRKASLDVERIKTLKAEGLGASAIAKMVGCSRGSVYRLLSEAA